MFDLRGSNCLVIDDGFDFLQEKFFSFHNKRFCATAEL